MARKINLENYVEVSERLRMFYERYPEGAVRTEMVRLEGGMVVFKAAVYRDAADPHPTTGWAYEREGSSPVNRDNFVENCETSAVGRALANLNFAGTRRPSKEEMAKVARMQAEERVETRDGDAKPPVRIRALLEELELSGKKRSRIEAKLEDGMTEQEAHDLEAYLLALRPKSA